MCVNQRLDIKMVFWCLLLSLLIIMGLTQFYCYGMVVLKNSYVNDLIFSSNHEVNFKIVLAIFIIIFLLTTSGFLSVVFDFYPCLILNAYILTCLSFVMFVIGIYFALSSHNVHAEGSILQNSMMDMQEYLDRPEWFTFNYTILAPIEREFKCCGVISWRDYWDEEASPQVNTEGNWLGMY